MRERGDTPPIVLCGTSEAIRRVSEAVERLSRMRTNILLIGESGTGRELIARAIHRSGGAAEPFTAIDCETFPAPLLERELFGAGAPRRSGTGAATSGVLGAEGGTLFLREITALPLSIRRKLLCALSSTREEPRAHERVRRDPRIIVAMQRETTLANGSAAEREGAIVPPTFLPLDIPSLRERIEDIPVLAARILACASEHRGRGPLTIDPQAMELLLAYPWPGNYRELENLLERAARIAKDAVVTVEDLIAAGGRGLAALQAGGSGRK
ncbi:MAG: sigma 54-interacting transcriptional regulator [Bacteroidota bacterium]|nr:sigma 54-interacting transcriptional regulator [Bacteroidota bacterium]